MNKEKDKLVASDHWKESSEKMDISLDQESDNTVESKQIEEKDKSEELFVPTDIDKEDEKYKDDSSGDSAMPIIKARNLDFVYNPGKGNEFHALKNISLEIYPEEFIIVFGPSGCGKSTLLNVIAGLETPDKGSIFVFNQDLTKMNSYDFAVYHRKHVGMIYQAYNLITSLTVLENVVLPQMFVNVRRGRRKRWGKELLKRFGIFEHANKIPTELSGGQQQRIGIARSIVNNPKIVLADEPVGNLDSKSAKLVLDILGDLNEKEKKTIILVTHNPEYLDHADRILYMKDGVIEREVINRRKKGMKKEVDKPKTVINQISELMRAYQGMTPEQINILIMPFKSKIFANHFISSRTMEETKIFEEAIQRRMLGTISEEEFFDILDKPARDGGVGFDRRTAHKVIRRINRVIRMAYYVYQKGHQHHDDVGEHEKITFEEKARKVTNYLYRTCYNDYYEHLNDKQKQRTEKAVENRLTMKIDKNIFYNILDRSIKEDGVGLNSKTAKAISKELELILILGFGVVGVSERMAKMSKRERDIEKAKQEGLELPKNVSEEIEKEESEENETQKTEYHKIPRPGEILNQIKNQLSQKVKTMDNIKKNEEDERDNLLKVEETVKNKVENDSSKNSNIEDDSFK